MKPKCYSYIRFSRPEQLRGDSLRRQLKMAEDYAAKHSLVLDNNLRFKDLGLSAFKGLQRTKGALAAFLQLVSDGQVPKGSVLIVESLDRLSREMVLDALSLFTDIINAGIKIVTLSDAFEYDRQSIKKNPMQLMMSLMIMTRANEESDRKSKMLLAAWEHKRENATEKKLTARAPLWLELSKDRARFIPVKERCDVIRMIFDMKLAGKGAELITQTLNQDPSLWKPTKKWRKSYVGKILRNKAVIGEFQPMRRIDGKRQDVGPPIKDYFPSVVPRETFIKVERLIKKNTFHGGRTGAISNLFSYIAKCGYCGGSMRLIDKGRGRKKLVCDNAVRKITCQRIPIKYQNFEDTILDFCKDLKVSDLIEDDSHLAELERLKDEVLLMDHRLETIKNEEAFLMKRIKKSLDDRIVDDYEKELSAIKDEKAAIKEDRIKVQTEIEKLSVLDNDIELRLEHIKDLKAHMQTLEGDELRDIRLMLRGKIRDLVDCINIFPYGSPRITEDFIKDAMQDLKNNMTPDALTTYKKDLEDRINNRDLLQHTIYFKGGSIRTLRPNKANILHMDFDRERGGLAALYTPEAIERLTRI